MSPPSQPVDWDAIKRQIEAVRLMTERGWEPSPDDKRRILRTRAQALELPIAAPAVKEAVIDVVIFELAGETYAIELPFVREVFPLKTYTPIPCTPSFVLGVINVRGQILSVVDLRHFFELPKLGLSELNKVIILRRDDLEFGILADAVLGVQSICRDRLQPSLPTLTGIRGAYLKGVTQDRWIVLDGSRLLSNKALIVQEHVQE